MKALIGREVARREHGRQHQAGRRRHPRDRVHRAGLPAGARRPGSARCAQPSLLTVLPRLAGARLLPPESVRGAGARPTISCGAREPRADARRRADACAAGRSAGSARASPRRWASPDVAALRRRAGAAARIVVADISPRCSPTAARRRGPASASTWRRCGKPASIADRCASGCAALLRRRRRAAGAARDAVRRQRACGACDETGRQRLKALLELLLVGAAGRGAALDGAAAHVRGARGDRPALGLFLAAGREPAARAAAGAALRATASSSPRSWRAARRCSTS